MNLKDIDDEVISITLSEPTIEEVRYLIDSYVLTVSEQKLLERYIECSGLYGVPKIKELLNQLGVNQDEINNKILYDKQTLFDKMCTLITNRRNQENKMIYKKVLEQSDFNVMGNEAVDIINRRYQANIQINDADILADLKDYPNYNVIEEIEEGISSGIETIDELTRGIPIGKVSTIISKDREYRHLYVNNLAYNTLMEEKNVLYISINYEKTLVYLEMIARHSCNEKFNKPLSKTELTTKFDENIYNYVYDDVYDQLNNYFKVYDINDFNLQNVFVFQRLFTLANQNFIKKNNKPIDLVIIDGLERLHIDKKRKVLTSRNTVESEYYLFFKEMSLNFVGTNNRIPIVITNESLSVYNEHLENGVYYNLSFISDTIKNYSDLILTVYGDRNLDKQKVINVSLLKFINDNKVNNLKVRADKEYSLIHYKIDSVDEPANSNVLIDRLLEERQSLKSKNDELSEELRSTQIKHSEEIMKVMELSAKSNCSINPEELKLDEF